MGYHLHEYHIFSPSFPSHSHTHTYHTPTDGYEEPINTDRDMYAARICYMSLQRQHQLPWLPEALVLWDLVITGQPSTLVQLNIPLSDDISRLNLINTQIIG